MTRVDIQHTNSLNFQTVQNDSGLEIGNRTDCITYCPFGECLQTSFVIYQNWEQFKIEVSIVGPIKCRSTQKLVASWGLLNTRHQNVKVDFSTRKITVYRRNSINKKYCFFAKMELTRQVLKTDIYRKQTRYSASQILTFHAIPKARCMPNSKNYKLLDFKC